MATIKEEKQKLNIMNILKCSEEEAEDIMKWDKIIDQGGRTPYDFDKEKEKEAKKMANAGTRTVYEFTKRERKENPTKSGIIADLARFLTELSDFATENVEIINKERQISFSIADEKFELTLVQKRKPKN